MTQRPKQMRFRQRAELAWPSRCAEHGSAAIELRTTRARDDVIERVTYRCGCTAERVVGWIKHYLERIA